MAQTDEDNLESLMTVRDNLIALIGSVTQKPKPTYDIDGQKVMWGEYLDQLRKQLAYTMQLIIDLQGPFEVESIGYI
jgi:hypothetical protein